MGLFGKKKEKEVPKIETEAQRKDREAAEQAAKFKKRAGKTTVASAPKLTASKEAKAPKAAVETANEKKEREMQEEKDAFKKRAGKTTVATAPKLTASKEAKAPKAAVETAMDKKEKEMQEEKDAYKKRAGKTTKATAPNLTASKEPKAVRDKIETKAEKADREAAEAKEKFNKRAGKTTVGSSPKLTESKSKKPEPRKIETAKEKKDREAAEAKAKYSKNHSTTAAKARTSKIAAGGGKTAAAAAAPLTTEGKSDLELFRQVFAPMGEKTDEAKLLRKKGFSAADPNGNGLCSLAELETFILKYLMNAYPKDKTTKVEKGRDLFDLYRPSYIRAFKDAADYKHDDGEVLAGTKSAKQDDFVSKGEFRLFCAYVCIYAGMYDGFSRIDGGGAGRAGDDRKIDLNEFLAGYKTLGDLGFVAFKDIKDDKEATDLMVKMDDNGGGVVLLDEWCDFIKKCEVEAGTEIGALLNEDESEADAKPKKSKGEGAAEESGEAKKKGKVNNSGFVIGKSATKELGEFISTFELLAERSPAGDAAREEDFKSADPNGNGLCSLAELETFVMKKLMAKYPKDKTTKVEKGRDLFDLYRPSYLRCFKDAADWKKDDGKTIKGTKGATQDDFVSKDEFRIFCTYLIAYGAMYDAFSKIDGGGAGRAGDDRRMDLNEWLAGYKGVTDYGFVALEEVKTSVKGKKSATEFFNKIDDNGGGVVLLDEWCDFIKKAEIAAGTPLGALLNEDENNLAAPISGDSGEEKSSAKRPTAKRAERGGKDEAIQAKGDKEKTKKVKESEDMKRSSKLALASLEAKVERNAKKREARERGEEVSDDEAETEDSPAEIEKLAIEAGAGKAF